MSEPTPLLPDPAALATAPEEELAEALRPLWEDAGPLVRRLVGMAFHSWVELIDCAASAIEDMDEAERTELLRAHPRIGDSPEALLARSEASWREQGAGRAPDTKTAARLLDLNMRYEAKFGFPFVEWVRGRPLPAIIPLIERRMERDRSTELAQGCTAMIAIARDRLGRLTARAGSADRPSTSREPRVNKPPQSSPPLRDGS